MFFIFILGWERISLRFYQVKLGRVRLFFLNAGRADFSYEPLGYGDVRRGGDDVRLYAEVNQARHGSGGVVRVQGGKDQMSRQGGVHGGLGGLQIPDLAHENYVGVLAQDGPESRGEVVSFLGVRLRLGDSGDVVFNRVLNRDDFYLRREDFFDESVQGRGFAGPGRPGGQNHAVRLFKLFRQFLQEVWLNPQIFKTERDGFGIQDS